MGKYVQLYKGDSFTFPPKGGTIYFVCCDCGLVHHFGFAIEDNGKIGFAVERDNRRTGQLRRYRSYVAKVFKN